VVALSLVMGTSSALPDFDFTFLTPPPHQLGRNLTLGRIGEFTCATKALAIIAVLAPFTPILASLEIVNTMLILHPLNTNSPYLNSLLNF